MNYWRELFRTEGMKLDHVICTSMSIDPSEMIRLMALANHYKSSSSDEDFKITNIMIDAMLMRNEKSSGWIDQFDFFYDKTNGQIQNRLPGYLSEKVVSILMRDDYLHPISIDTVFHAKIILCRFLNNDNKAKWKALVSSHNLTLNYCYENAVLLESIEKSGEDSNHMFSQMLAFCKEKILSDVKDEAKTKAFGEYIAELSKLKFRLYKDDFEKYKIDVNISGIDPKNNTPFFKDIYKLIVKYPAMWKVVSPSYETGHVFIDLNENSELIYGPVEKSSEFIASHAKMFFKLNEEGACTDIWMGSANCSDSGLGGQYDKDNNVCNEKQNCNVECLVHISKADKSILPEYALNISGFSFNKKEFIKISNFSQPNGNGILNAIMSAYNLEMTYSPKSDGIARMIVKLSLKNINKKIGSKDINEINSNGFKITILPLGYSERFYDITSELNNEEIFPRVNKFFYGTKNNTASYVLRLRIEKGYEKQERLWHADKTNEEKTGIDNLLVDEIYRNIINFNASEYIGQDKETRCDEFRDLWKKIFEIKKEKPLVLNQLDMVLRNYLDALRLCGKNIDPRVFYEKADEGLTVYQQDAIDQAVKRLKENKRYLIADEAGLGKTYIARGIIKELKDKQETPLRVLYFVSNLYLLEKTAEKLLKGNSDWKRVDGFMYTLGTKPQKYECDRISHVYGAIQNYSTTILTPNNSHGYHTVELFMVSGNIYGNSAMGGIEGKDYERKFLQKSLNDDNSDIKELRRKAIDNLVEKKEIDLIICDEFHRYPDAAKEIGNDWESTPVLFLSATPYNWYSSQLNMTQDGFESGTALTKEDSDKGLSSIEDILKLLKANINYDERISEEVLSDKMKDYIWRNERVFGVDSKRLDLPGKEQFYDEKYTASIKKRYDDEKKDVSLFEQLFPGRFSFMCKGKYNTGKNYYKDLYKGTVVDDDFVFDENNAVKEKLVSENYKLNCIKNIQVDPMRDMLWITPVKSRYRPGAPFIKNATKLLVFSGYLMVPRGISTIFSQYVIDNKSDNSNEKPDLSYLDKAIDEIKKKENDNTISEILIPEEGLELDEYLEKIEGQINEDDADKAEKSLLFVGSPYFIFQRMGATPEQARESADSFYSYLKTNDKLVVLHRALSKINKSTNSQKLLYYFCCGCLEDVFNEYYYLMDASDFDKFQSKLKVVFEFKGVNLTALNNKTYDPWKGSCKKEPVKNATINCIYAVPFTPDQDDNGKQLTSKGGEIFQGSVQDSFNSPFWPMILSTTSAGQEGIDLDAYCRRIMHYTVPYSPMAFEQRDGRIDRRKSLAAREKINILWGRYLRGLYLKDISENSFWKDIFGFGKDASGLSPMWCLRERVDEIGLERIIPFLPGTDEYNAYKYLLDVKNQYRSAFGMPDEKGHYFIDKKGLKLNDISLN